ncbi:Cytosol aminopeptidase, catalytic domain [Apophysomyces ossiformis]|uniref:Cytosol aminopeptidase, catalytic domain n=1 Tax=Apophysomyces ossiformis TaxID=679940 RepID=A0A8H7EU85_9FUNG|nr:Cytosol aminopeptidase, catalytic domain [Apophysomyces ossiformis]
MALPNLKIYGKQDNVLSVLEKDTYDGVIVLFTDKKALVQVVPTAQKWLDLDASFGDAVQLLIPEDAQPGKRVIIAPVGSVRNDFDDVRRFQDAAFAAGQRALKAGIVSPLVCFADVPGDVSLAWTFTEDEDYKHFLEVTILAILESSYEPIDAREHAVRVNKPLKTFETCGFLSTLEEAKTADLLKTVVAIESGRRVAKDIGSPDPERMSPIQIVKYLREEFKDAKNVKMTVIEDIDVIKKEYPLAHAVTRASLAVPRHHPRFVHFEYVAPDQQKVKENLYFVGKGVTYDTGGADIKCSGHMRDMSRDKCGAAAVAGFFKTVELLQPENVNLTAGLALVRNSIGSDSYVCDEVIYSRNGTRVLVGNTDAEGRMVMTDLLCEFKERVLSQKKSGAVASKAPSLLFTVATLTGHALRAYNGYGIALDNGFARKNRVARRIFDAGHVLADPFEISTMRREDLEVVQPGRSSEDVVQANDQPSTMTNRGHQYPAGFMLIASGLDKHGLSHEIPIGYTHVDVAGSAELISAERWSLPRVTGSPVSAFTGAFLL